MNYKEILENNIKIVKYYGTRKQMTIWIEEMSELTKVICKWNRKYEELEGDLTPKLLSEFQEEIADVMVMLEQFKLYYDISSEEITNIFWNKVERQLKRIEEGK